jgi:hypothetical protein
MEMSRTVRLLAGHIESRSGRFRLWSIGRISEAR